MPCPLGTATLASNRSTPLVPLLRHNAVVLVSTRGLMVKFLLRRTLYRNLRTNGLLLIIRTKLLGFGLFVTATGPTIALSFDRINEPVV